MVPSDGVTPSAAGVAMPPARPVDRPVRLVPVRARDVLVLLFLREVLRLRVPVALRRAVVRPAVDLRREPPERVALRVPVDRLAVDLRRVPVERFAVERLVLARRVVDLRVPVERLAVDLRRVPVERFAVERLAVDLRRVPVERFAVERLAVDLRAPVERFAVDLRRVPVERFAVVLRVPVDRFAVVLRAVLLRRVPVERFAVDRVPLDRVELDLLLAVAMCLLLLGEFGGNNYWRSMSVAPAVIQQKGHLSYLEMSSTTSPVRLSAACLATSACATMPTSFPSSSTTGSRRTW